jgi:hypothetical protein
MPPTQASTSGSSPAINDRVAATTVRQGERQGSDFADWLPIDAASGWLRTAGGVFPAEHLARAPEPVAARGVGALDAVGHVTILLAWAIGAFLVALQWFRWEPHTSGKAGGFVV